jgi:hypothetical protein
MTNIPETDIEEDFQTNVISMPSGKLCEIIATFRYVGLLREESIVAMGELARRRGIGDAFAFEDEIQRLLEDLPKVKKDITSMFKVPGLGKIF